MRDEKGERRKEKWVHDFLVMLTELLISYHIYILLSFTYISRYASTSTSTSTYACFYPYTVIPQF